MKKKSLRTIWNMFAIFIVLFSVNLVVREISDATQRMWLIMDLWVILLSIILLLKYKLPGRTGIIISTIFGLVVSLSYINIGGFSISIFCFHYCFIYFGSHSHI